MGTSRDDLFEEIVRNARNDRRRLEHVADGLTRVAEESEAGMDAAAAFSEELSKITDSLTRVNQQLVELVKIESKSAPPKEVTKLTKGEVEDIYDEMNPQEVN